MLILAGLAIVIASITAGYLLEHGNIAVLLQPAELLIIGGSAIGMVIAANPLRNLKRLGAVLGGMRQQPAYSKAYYLDSLKLLYVLFTYTRRHGVASLEDHMEAPQKSEIFASYSALTKDPAALTFVCDSFRMVISAGTDPDELERLMGIDMDVQRQDRHQPVRALMTIADSLPGLGIVAAVLGVVVTMQALGGPASEIGQQVAAALVGTFLGILLCYGVVGPISSHLDALNHARGEYLRVLRIGIISFLKGNSPVVATEFARRSIPLDLRPSFSTMEQEVRRNTKLPSGQAEAAEPIAFRSA
jgi:chemotaxis protein MotA